MQSSQDDEHLNAYEQTARDRLSPILGQFRRTDRPGGPQGVHDFEVSLPGGLAAAVEVTSEVDARRLALEASAETHLSSLTLPGSNCLWLVGLAAGAKVRTLKHDLPQLLTELEEAGRTDARDLGDYLDPFVHRLRALGIESVRARPPKAGCEGKVLVQAGTYGGWGWDAKQIDAWLGELLASDLGFNKLQKLARSGAVQRHLVVVLDSFSQANIGISLGLTARLERGVLNYCIPSLTPPQPLTHLWILPQSHVWDGLAWARAGTWRILPGDLGRVR